MPATLRFVCALFSVLLLGSPQWAQLPPAEKLSPQDQREFTRELARLEKLLLTANNKPAIELQIANTYAAGGRYIEAVHRLRKLVDANLGFDPSRDPDFAKVRGSAEFQQIMDEVHRQTPAINTSRLVTTLNARGVQPENIAFDTQRAALLLGNTAEFELVTCSRSGDCTSFVAPKPGETGYALGLKVDLRAHVIWATDNMPEAASVRCYDLRTGGLLRTASIAGKHIFNDLVISPLSTLYITDTAEGSVYQLSPGTTTLQKIAPQHTFTAANGIAISGDGRLLYVSTWDDGIDIVDVASGAVRPVTHPSDICLAFIDGLYFTRGALVAIQNGPMLPRIVAFTIGADVSQITAMKILERRNPAFDGLTTGVIVDEDLYYVANPQTDKERGTNLRSLQVFSLPVISH